MTPIIILTIIVSPAANDITLKTSRRNVAMLASMVLPGTGQLLTNAKNRGEVMLWLDGIFWAGWAGFSWYRSSRNQDAQLIAAKYARADITIKDPQYYRALERYDNAQEYNEDIRREARDLYPDDPDAQRRYYESHGYFGRSQWDWEADSIRIYSYWRTRRSARDAGMTVSFITAALLLNRFVSLLDCIFFTPGADIKHRVEINPSQNQPGVELRYRF
ncbi:MAG: hypothetical protein ABIK47_02900 [candidate division WOR-3 bacterium]